MKPYTLADAEADLRAALDAGDPELIQAAKGSLSPLYATPARPVAVLGAALWYAEHGLAVFPLLPGDKKPYPGSRGVLEATTSAEVVWTMHRDRPGCNWGLATGHLVDVIDFDGPAAHVAWGEKYGDSWEDAGVTVLGTVSTPRPGGLHVYVPATGRGNKAGMLPSVDYRGLGGYVVVPPSATELGTYRWLRPLDLP